MRALLRDDRHEIYECRLLNYTDEQEFRKCCEPESELMEHRRCWHLYYARRTHDSKSYYVFSAVSRKNANITQYRIAILFHYGKLNLYPAVCPSWDFCGDHPHKSLKTLFL